MNTLEKLKIAGNRNILVYDADAQKSFLTNRLVCLLSPVFHDNPMYIDENLEDWENNKYATLRTILITDRVKYRGGEGCEFSFKGLNIYGVDIKQSDIDITQEYLKLGYSLAYQDQEVILCIALNKDGQEEYLVGSC